MEGSVHVYPGKIIDKKVVTTKAEVYAVPTTSQARPTTQVETGLLGEAALTAGPKELTETNETAMVTDSFSSISVSDRETPGGVDNEPLTAQYVEQSSDPAMTEGTEQEDEGMEMLPPDDCDRAHLRLRLSEHRPYHQIPASKPKDQTPIEPREGLDIEAYPPLPQSEGVGIGGVQGYDKNPKNLPLGVPAQRKTEAGSRPVEVTRSPPTTTPKSSEESHGTGPQKSKRDVVVQLKRLHKIHLKMTVVMRLSQYWT